MAAATRHAFLNARISGLRRRLLDPAGFRAVLAGNGQDDAALRMAGLGDDAAGGDPVAGARALVGLLVREVSILAQPLTGPARAFIVFWGRQVELEALKGLIRAAAAGEREEPAADPGSFSGLPYDELRRADDVADLLRRLERTPYADMARAARRRFEQQGSLSAIEAAIDRRYFAGLVKRAQQLDRRDRGAVQGLLGPLVDRTNLVWLLRYRLTYAMGVGEAYYLLVPDGGRLSAPLLRTLAQRSSLDEVIADLPEALRRPLDGAASIAAVEQVLNAGIERTAWRILSRETFSLARAFAYLVLRQIQIGRLQAILRGRALGVNPAMIGLAGGLPAPADMAHAGG